MNTEYIPIAALNQYAYCSHRCRWMYRYILYLESNSPSAAWIKSTFAWEEEIEGRLEETS
jgi:hypothetical protein